MVARWMLSDYVERNLDDKLDAMPGRGRRVCGGDLPRRGVRLAQDPLRQWDARASVCGILESRLVLH